MVVRVALVRNVVGQGAGQASEDAVVLAHLADGDLSAYTAAQL